MKPSTHDLHQQHEQLMHGEGCAGCGKLARSFSECPRCGQEWCDDCWGSDGEICRECVAEIAAAKWEGEL